MPSFRGKMDRVSGDTRNGDRIDFHPARHGRFAVGDVREPGLAGCQARAEEAPWVAEALAGSTPVTPYAACSPTATADGPPTSIEAGRTDATETLCPGASDAGLSHESAR